MSEDALALVYGVPRDFTPVAGVWMIHKHKLSRDLLGPSVPFGVPTAVVYAEIGPDGWRELPSDIARGRQRAAGLFD